MRIGLLGSVQVLAGDSWWEVGPAQRCLVLAALATDAGRLVSREVLVDRVWGGSAPGGAWRTVQTHIPLIRSALVQAGIPAEAVRVRSRAGYVLDVDPELVDVHRFRSLVAQAGGDGALPDAEVIARWREAVGLWRGEPLAGLGGSWAERIRDGWYAEYRDAVLGWAYAEIRTGDPTTVIGPLTDLIGRYPLVEALPAMLIRALHAAGRRSEALECYAAVRQRLDEELAERPGPELQAVYQAMLRREPALPPPAGALPAGAAVPAQLPADVRGFAGRADQLDRLDGIAEAVSRGDGATTAVLAIAGTAGVGKTALAVHWAHRAAKRFPDGQLYVDLHGFEPDRAVVDPSTAIRGFLDALGVPPRRIPTDREAQTALYRTLLADKRMLVVLDNARDSAQVRSLLPGAPGCLVLVTSRNQLTSLVAATGAQPVALDLLTPGEARDLLARRLDAHRVAAEPDAVDTLIARCAHLPLALALVAARAATQPRLPLTSLAAELSDAGTRLDVLADPDPATDLRAVFSWSFTALTPPAARLFRLLGLHPGADITVPAAASLAGLPVTDLRPLLAELTAANLITEHRPGRYTFHDLLRAYADDLARQAETVEHRRAATGRVLDHYLRSADAANRILVPARDPIDLDPAEPGSVPERPATHAAAMEWFTAEHAVLLAAVRHAAVTEQHRYTWTLAWSLAPFLDLRRHWHDRVDVSLAAVTATERLGDLAASAHAYRLVAFSYLRLGRHAEARTHLERALGHANRAGDLACQARVEYTLGQLEHSLGRHAEALHHARLALELATRTGHQPGIARALNSVGWYHSKLGEHRVALGYCRRALAMLGEIGDRDGQAHTWDSLGYINHHLGNHTEAVSCYHRAIDLHRDLGNHWYVADSLSNLGDSRHGTGDHAAARTAWEQALTVLDGLQDPRADTVRSKIEKLGSG